MALVVARSAVAVVVEAGLADRRDPRVARQLLERLGRRIVEAGRQPLGWRPAAANTASWASASAIAAALASSSMPTVSIRRTPTRAASATRIAVSALQSPRWQWESITPRVSQPQRSLRSNPRTASAITATVYATANANAPALASCAPPNGPSSTARPVIPVVSEVSRWRPCW